MNPPNEQGLRPFLTIQSLSEAVLLCLLMVGKSTQTTLNTKLFQLFCLTIIKQHSMMDSKRLPRYNSSRALRFHPYRRMGRYSPVAIDLDVGPFSEH